MVHERIFEHTDGDGDAIRVLSWVQPEKTYLILHSDTNDGPGSVPVRMYPEEVWSLIEALVSWYAVNGSRDITLTASPQTQPTVEDRCLGCGHLYGGHSEDTEGPCLIDACDCPRWNRVTFTEPESVPERCIVGPSRIPGVQCVKDDGHSDTHDDPALRLEALRLAVQRSAGMDLSRHAVMDIAREFEAYLRGVESEASDPSQDPERDCLCHHAKWLHLTPQGTGSNGACRADMCSCTERRPW